MNATVRNSIRMALLQTGLLVVGILGVAASNRLASGLGHPNLRDFLFFLNHGWMLLPLPILWVALAAEAALNRSRRPAWWRNSVFLAGPTLIALLAVSLAMEIREPWRTERAADNANPESTF